MSRHKKKKKERPDPRATGHKPYTQSKWHHTLKAETKKTIFAVFLFIIAAISLLSYWDKGGILGSYLKKVLVMLFGQGYFFAPITLVLVAFSLLLSLKEDARRRKAGDGIVGRHIFAATIIGGVLFLGAILGL